MTRLSLSIQDILYDVVTSLLIKHKPAKPRHHLIEETKAHL